MFYFRFKKNSPGNEFRSSTYTIIQYRNHTHCHDHGSPGDVAAGFCVTWKGYARFPGSSCRYQRERRGGSLTYWTGSFIIEDSVFKMKARIAADLKFDRCRTTSKVIVHTSRRLQNSNKSQFSIQVPCGCCCYQSDRWRATSQNEWGPEK